MESKQARFRPGLIRSAKTMEITDVEQQVLQAWAKEIPVVKAETHIEMIRERMKEIAYHEAGHAAVKAFFGDDHSHFSGITGQKGKTNHKKREG